MHIRLKLLLKPALIILLFLISTVAAARQNQLDFTGAGAVSDFQGESKIRYSLVTKSRFSTFPNSGGLGFIFILDLQYLIITPNLGAAVAFRTGGRSYFEAGAGLFLKGARNPAGLIVLGVGFPIVSNFFISFPFHWEVSDTNWSAIRWGPYLGIRF